MQRHERNELLVAASRRERRPHTLKHRVLQLPRNSLINTFTKNQASRIRKPIQHHTTGSTRRSPQPAMPSFRTRDRRLLPPFPRPETVYTLLTYRPYRAMRQVGHTSSGEVTFELARRKIDCKASTFPLSTEPIRFHRSATTRR